MKQTVITSILIVLIVGMLAFIIWGSKAKQENTSKVDAQQGQAEQPVADAPIFFYGNTCPHCKDVEAWMETNDVEAKLTVIKKEVYDNRQNAQELTLAAQSCGLDTTSIGVPFLYTIDHQCLIGSPDITAYLSTQIQTLGSTPTASPSEEGIQQ